MNIRFQFKGTTIYVDLQEKKPIVTVTAVRFVGKGCWGKSAEDSADDYIVDSIYEVLAQKEIKVAEGDRYHAEKYGGKHGQWIISAEPYSINHTMHKGYSGFSAIQQFGESEDYALKNQQLLTEAIHHFSIKCATDITFSNENEEEAFYQYFPNPHKMGKIKKKIEEYNSAMELLGEELKLHRNFYADLCSFRAQSNPISNFNKFYSDRAKYYSEDHSFELKFYKNTHVKKSEEEEIKGVKDHKPLLVLSIKSLDKRLLDSWLLYQRAGEEIKKNAPNGSDEKIIAKTKERHAGLKNFINHAFQELLTVTKALPGELCYLYVIDCVSEKIWDEQIAEIEMIAEDTVQNINKKLMFLEQFNEQINLLFQNIPWSWGFNVSDNEVKAKGYLKENQKKVQKRISEISEARKVVKEKAEHLSEEMKQHPNMPRAFLADTAFISNGKFKRKMKNPVIDEKGKSYEEGTLKDAKVQIKNYALMGLIELYDSKKDIFGMEYEDIIDSIQDPFTLEPLIDPATTNAGQTYERKEVEKVLIDPKTRDVITHRIPNSAMKLFIQELAAKNPKMILDKFITEGWDITPENIERYTDWINELELADKHKYINFVRYMAKINRLELAVADKLIHINIARRASELDQEKDQKAEKDIETKNNIPLSLRKRFDLLFCHDMKQLIVDFFHSFESKELRERRLSQIREIYRIYERTAEKLQQIEEKSDQQEIINSLLNLMEDMAKVKTLFNESDVLIDPNMKRWSDQFSFFQEETYKAIDQIRQHRADADYEPQNQPKDVKSIQEEKKQSASPVAVDDEIRVLDPDLATFLPKKIQEHLKTLHKKEPNFSVKDLLHNALTDLAIQYGPTKLNEIFNEKKDTLTAGEHLLFWAVKHGDGRIVRLLEGHGVNINIRDEKQCQPLHWAAKLENQELVAFFLKKEAEVKKDFSGHTPAHYAARSKNHELIMLFPSKYLLEIDKDKKLPLHHAAESGASSTVLTILQNCRNKAFIDGQDQLGDTAMHKAAIRLGSPDSKEHREFVRIIKMLLNAGDSKDVINKKGEKPIDIANQLLDPVLAARIFTPVQGSHSFSDNFYAKVLEDDLDQAPSEGERCTIS